MCYVDGSIDQVTSTCPMCKVFRPATARCPHKKETCRNRILHPRHDVVHFVNAEVQTFNGCGYCKWAHRNPPPNRAGIYNPGWPGCCRPPLSHEQVLVPPADWHAVSIVHKVPIPSEIRHILDSLRQFYPINGKRSPTTTRAMLTSSMRSSSAATLHKLKVGDSMKQSSTSPNTPSRTSAANLHDTPGKTADRIRTTPPATVRRLSMGDTELSQALSNGKLSQAKASPPRSPESVSSSSGASPKRRSLQATGTVIPPVAGMSKPRSTLTPKLNSKTNPLDDAVDDTKSVISAASDSSSEGSLRSLGSRSSAQDSGTVTSEGGFTDYLSDESEAEIQRQAEARAAILEQNRMEEQEFRAARQQLASVDLQPPKSWNPPTATTPPLQPVV